MSTRRCTPDRRTIHGRTRPSRPVLSVTVLAVLLPFLAACEGASEVTPTGPTPDAAESARSEAGEAEMRTALATFRRATARYHRVEAAIADGFVQILPCQANPDGRGALGIPYARLDRFDTVIDLAKPEILFYEPRRNGELRLVGGEPVVPIEAWPDDDPPSLFGREFHRNEEHGLYGLHMWIWRPSPDGVFSFWNANVSCQFAE